MQKEECHMTVNLLCEEACDNKKCTPAVESGFSTGPSKLGVVDWLKCVFMKVLH